MILYILSPSLNAQLAPPHRPLILALRLEVPINQREERIDRHALYGAISGEKGTIDLT